MKNECNRAAEASPFYLMLFSGRYINVYRHVRIISALRALYMVKEKSRRNSIDDGRAFQRIIKARRKHLWKSVSKKQHFWKYFRKYS